MVTGIWETTSVIERPAAGSALLIERSDALAVAHERMDGRSAFGEAAMNEETTLVLRGEVDLRTVPHFEAVLDSVVSLQPLACVVDLSRATSIGEDVLELIDARQADVPALTVRLPARMAADPRVPVSRA